MLENKIVGASLEEVTENPKALLSGLESDSIVELYNPLDAGFRVQFARSIVAPARETENQRAERIRLAQLGVDTKKQGNSVLHSIQHITLPAKETIKLPGNIAQVAVTQMVNYILQIRDQHGKLADAFARNEVEKEIVIKVNNNTIDYLNTPSAEDLDMRRIAELNNGTEAEPKNEPRREFAGLGEVSASGDADTANEAKRRGRKPRFE